MSNANITPPPVNVKSGAGPRPSEAPAPEKAPHAEKTPHFTTRQSDFGPPTGNPGRRGQWTQVYGDIDVSSAAGRWFVAEGLDERSAGNLRSSIRQHYRGQDRSVQVVSRKADDGTYAVWAKLNEEGS